MKAVGKLHHMFHGEYGFSILLIFDSPEDAVNAHERMFGFFGFTQAKQQPNCLTRSASGEEGKILLDKIKSVIEPLRVDTPCQLYDCKRKSAKKRVRHAIDGIAHSIDYGPTFTIEIV